MVAGSGKRQLAHGKITWLRVSGDELSARVKTGDDQGRALAVPLANAFGVLAPRSDGPIMQKVPSNPLWGRLVSVRTRFHGLFTPDGVSFTFPSRYSYTIGPKNRVFASRVVPRSSTSLAAGGVLRPCLVNQQTTSRLSYSRRGFHPLRQAIPGPLKSKLYCLVARSGGFSVFAHHY